MRSPWVIVPLALLLAVGLSGCLQTGGEGPLRGQTAPAFTLTSIDNETVGTNASAGRVMLIDFMGARCPACHTAMRALIPLQEEFGDRVDFVSIDMGARFAGLGGRNEQELRDEFLSRYDPEPAWPFAMDTNQEAVAERYEVIAIPSTVVIDAEGVIACREGGVPSHDRVAGWLNHTLEHGYDPDFTC
jgi:thiol-disulfide isomerase/thioredoxin